MVKSFSIVSLLLFHLALGANSLEDFCSEKEGQILTKYQCPKSRLTLPVKTCEYRNVQGDKLFVNGCTGPSGGFESIFFTACLRHDLCYHHEPATNGLDRKDCDKAFLDSTLKACENNVTDEKEAEKCRSWANIMFLALRVIGAPAFHCSDSVANYDFDRSRYF